MTNGKEHLAYYNLVQFILYAFIVVEIVLNLYINHPSVGIFNVLLKRIQTLQVLSVPIYSKLFTLFLICLLAVGSTVKKEIRINTTRQVLLPLFSGLLMLFGSIVLLNKHQSFQKDTVILQTDFYGITYITCSILGALFSAIAIDNISKFLRVNFGKDKWNTEAESFMQETSPILSMHHINLPTKFYYNKKIHNGYINVNPYRGLMVMGTPGSGKSYSVINPAIRQLIRKEFSICLYDFKFPDLAKIAFYHFLKMKKQGKMKKFNFHVINLDDVSKSRRINPLNSKYVKTLSEAQEVSTALIEALKKGDKSGGSDRFFTQSAINFLASAIYFLAKYKNGKYSSLPHLIAFLNLEYEYIFECMLTNPELESLLSPFLSAHNKKAYDQLEGQVGTLKIFISRLATKETFWVFSHDDFNLKISDPENPSILVLANSPQTQDINSALYAIIVNRLISLINSKGNLPSCIIADEAPTLYIHRLENLIATARSNKVGVILGLQELPQFRQQYGKETASTISSIIGNVISGSVRDKETLDWLEKLFGKVRQQGESINIDRSKTSISINEKLDALIPAGKIASLNTSEVVGIIAKDISNVAYTGKFQPAVVNCKISLDEKEILKEENGYLELPTYYQFNSDKEEQLLQNFYRINKEIQDLIRDVKWDLAFKT